MVAGGYSLYAAFLVTLHALSVFAGVLRDSPGRMKRMSPPAPNGTVYYGDFSQDCETNNAVCATVQLGGNGALIRRICACLGRAECPDTPDIHDGHTLFNGMATYSKLCRPLEYLRNCSSGEVAVVADDRGVQEIFCQCSAQLVPTMTSDVDRRYTYICGQVPECASGAPCRMRYHNLMENGDVSWRFRGDRALCSCSWELGEMCHGTPYMDLNVTDLNFDDVGFYSYHHCVNVMSSSSEENDDSNDDDDVDIFDENNDK